jgi:hypothetical protein
MRMLDHKGLYCYIYYNRYVKATHLLGKSSKNQHIRSGIAMSILPMKETTRCNAQHLSMCISILWIK